MEEKQELSFTWAECELAGYRKGFISVRFDFVKNILIWKDSNRWFNNFVRGLPHDQMTSCYQAFCNFLRENRGMTGPDPVEPNHYIWHVLMGDANNSIEMSGIDLDKPAWLELIQAIEHAGKRVFKL